MPPFAENLWSLRQAAGLTTDDLAARLHLAVEAVEALEAPGAPLPDLPLLVRLADALGCRVDALLEGEDEEFDAPARRHAALIAARLGRARTLMARARAERHRATLTRAHEARLDETGLLRTIDRCRAWVMADEPGVTEAREIERALDAHIAQVEAALESLPASSRGDHPRPALDSPPPAAWPVAAPAAITPPAAPATVTSASSSPSVPATRPRRGQRKTLWSTARSPGQHECVLVTAGTSVAVELHRDGTLVEALECATLDEAFRRSAEWKRTYLTTAMLALPDVPR